MNYVFTTHTDCHFNKIIIWIWLEFFWNWRWKKHELHIIMRVIKTCLTTPCSVSESSESHVKHIVYIFCTCKDKHNFLHSSSFGKQWCNSGIEPWNYSILKLDKFVRPTRFINHHTKKKTRTSVNDFSTWFRNTTIYAYGKVYWLITN